MGESVTLPGGQVCQRLEETHSRRYVSIFGEFVLKRAVYGSREGQKIEFVPLDNRLQFPESVFSYVLQDWDQSLCVEEAFSQAKSTVARMLGLKQSVDSLERMNVQMAELVEAFRDERTLPSAEEEGAIVVSSADGKGVVMRRAADEAAPPAHRTKGEKASRKEMAIVGAVYTVDRSCARLRKWWRHCSATTATHPNAIVPSRATSRRWRAWPTPTASRRIRGSR